MNHNHTMQASVQYYLEERRRLGFALKSQGTELMRFARFADSRGHQGPLTLDLQLDWAREHVARTSTVTAARRLEAVRSFAAHYRQFEPATEVPPPFILGRGHRRLAPHIYTAQEIGDLLDLSGRMTPLGGLRPLTYKTLFGLIAATGLRISEALKLQLTDVDLPAATLTVRQRSSISRAAYPCTPASYKLCPTTSMHVNGSSAARAKRPSSPRGQAARYR